MLNIKQVMHVTDNSIKAEYLFSTEVLVSEVYESSKFPAICAELKL